MIKPEYVSIFKEVNDLKAQAEKLYGAAADLMDPIFNEVVKRADPKEIEEMIQVMPAGFFRAELRGFYLTLNKEVK